MARRRDKQGPGGATEGGPEPKRRRFRLLRSAGVRFAVLYALVFGVSTVVLGASLRYSTLGLMNRETHDAIQADWQSLNNHFQQGGLPGLVLSIRNRIDEDISRNAIYLLVDPLGNRIVGNLVRWPPQVIDSPPGWYEVAVVAGNNKRSQALLREYELPGGFRLLIGRDQRASAQLRRILRDGLIQLLVDRGFIVTAAVGDPAGLTQAVAADPPDVAVVDIRMPPTFTDEGLRAAHRIRSEQPSTAVLGLSQYVEEAYALDLLSESTERTGYLLKDTPRPDLVRAVREYVLTLLVATAVTYLLTPLVRRLAIRFKVVIPARDRDVHAEPIPRMGGVAIFAGVAAGLLAAEGGDGVGGGPRLRGLRGLRGSSAVGGTGVEGHDVTLHPRRGRGERRRSRTAASFDTGGAGTVRWWAMRWRAMRRSTRRWTGRSSRQ